MVDGATLTYTSVPAQTGGSDSVGSIAIDSLTNKIYVANTCGNDPSCTLSTGTVTVIDGATLAFANLFVGWKPWTLAVNPATNRVYVPNSYGNDPIRRSDGTVSVIDGTPPTACNLFRWSRRAGRLTRGRARVVAVLFQGGTLPDTSLFPADGNCAIPASAAAYSLERHGGSAGATGISDDLAHGTDAACSFNDELAGWPRQG